MKRPSLARRKGTPGAKARGNASASCACAAVVANCGGASLAMVACRIARWLCGSRWQRWHGPLPFPGDRSCGGKASSFRLVGDGLDELGDGAGEAVDVNASAVACFEQAGQSGFIFKG